MVRLCVYIVSRRRQRRPETLGRLGRLCVWFRILLGSERRLSIWLPPSTSLSSILSPPPPPLRPLVRLGRYRWHLSRQTQCRAALGRPVSRWGRHRAGRSMPTRRRWLRLMEEIPVVEATRVRVSDSLRSFFTLPLGRIQQRRFNRSGRSSLPLRYLVFLSVFLPFLHHDIVRVDGLTFALSASSRPTDWLWLTILQGLSSCNWHRSFVTFLFSSSTR